MLLFTVPWFEDLEGGRFPDLVFEFKDKRSKDALVCETLGAVRSDGAPFEGGLGFAVGSCGEGPRGR